MGKPLAYFLAWSCYGTWLHGDARGSVDALHNQVCSFGLAEDEELQREEADRMRGDIYTLSEDARKVVDETVRRHCEIRGWRLLALNVRTTHVHVVVDCVNPSDPDTAMEQFKAWGDEEAA